MTDDARDAAIGRTVREFRDKNERLGAIRSELARAADTLGALSGTLKSNPQLVNFGGDSFPLEDVRRAVQINKAHVDAEHLHTLVRDYRQLLGEVNRLKEQLEEFGVRGL